MSNIIQTMLLTLIAVSLCTGVALFALREKARRYRALTEDALKYLISSAFEQQQITPDTLAGALHLSRSDILALIERLQSKLYIDYEQNHLVLTPLGRQRGLRLLRAHRLIERYLHDEANMPLDRIHAVAERREHKLTDKQITELEAHLGYPQSDPHGDPIPTPQGQIPDIPRFILKDWPLNWPATIIHIEDEPADVFHRITKLGFLPSSLITILQVSESSLTIQHQDQTIKLPKTLASSIHVQAADDHAIQQESYMTLAELPDRHQARVVTIHDQCQGLARRRLLDLGVTPGATIATELASPGRSARAYRIRGTLIALRKDQASQIAIQPIPA
ncbi:Iron-dependent repressor IdeR [Poriferisphaera corsica]|uniref:Iron-dependent repressor IdeR n=1 Tax=Poriferisphaera corsica TaxID=2528020 RepID=A0A517YPU6_9BACT|nr:metal-dependent transcriptional regulator [Poriferisphaera corsica]QDU32241.1 Iron-dependent repressor IdeR [Poriferisphaera corsica]